MPVKYWAYILNATAWVLALWTLFISIPLKGDYALMMGFQICLPWIVLLLIAKEIDTFSLIGQRDDQRQRIDSAFLIPGFMLMLRAILDFHMLEWSFLITAALFCALLLAVCALRVSPHMRKRKTAMVALVLLVMPYGFGAFIMADVVLDKSAPQKFETAVVGKHISHSRRSPDLYEIDIAPWGPKTSETHGIPIDKGFYDDLNIGDTVCAGMKAGTLSIAWYRVEDCSRISSL